MSLKVLTGGRQQPDHAVEPVLLDGGKKAFADVVDCIARAQCSIRLRTFLWRDDETGNLIGKALLDAADRGVKVSIAKDRIAAAYEYSGGNKQSFFHKRVDPTRRFQAWVLSAVYDLPGSARQRPNPLAQALLGHPNVNIRDEKRFDHSKVFVFDEDVIVLGSMGIGDEHHLNWVETAVRVHGAESVRRLDERLAGQVQFDHQRPVDFLVHSHGDADVAKLKSDRLALIARAERRLVVAMAYLGDPQFTDALVRAVRRGVDVTLLTAGRANVLGDLNRGHCNRLLRLTGAPRNLRIFFHPRMIHTKGVAVDDRYLDLGSANFTRLSNGVYGEINVYLDHRATATQFRVNVELQCSDSEEVRGAVRYRKMFFHAERAIEAFQGRATRKTGAQV